MNFKIFEGSDSPLRSNSYLLFGNPKIQIDAGSKTDAEVVVLTHCHFDHIFYSNEMKRTGAKIYASKETADAVKNMNEETCVFFYGEMKPFDVDVVIKEGDEIKNENFNLKVIETPGHCRGAICLWEEKERILFSGDTIFDRGIYGRTDLPGGDENELEKSIKKLWQLKPKVIAPGHGEIINL